MIAKILGKIGLPLLVKYLGKALSGMNCTVAQEAGQMLGSVDDAHSKPQNFVGRT